MRQHYVYVNERQLHAMWGDIVQQPSSKRVRELSCVLVQWLQCVDGRFLPTVRKCSELQRSCFEFQWFPAIMLLLVLPGMDWCFVRNVKRVHQCWKLQRPRNDSVWEHADMLLHVSTGVDGHELRDTERMHDNCGLQRPCLGGHGQSTIMFMLLLPGMDRYEL